MPLADKMTLAKIILALSLFLMLILCHVLADSPTDDATPPKFKITSSRRMDEPPSIEVSFANGIKDDLVLTHYKMYPNSVGGCNYLGHLKNDDMSTAAVTGCLNNPDDKMEITLLSQHSTNSMFAVNFLGETEVITSPFEEGGRSVLHPLNPLNM